MAALGLAGALAGMMGAVGNAMKDKYDKKPSSGGSSGGGSSASVTTTTTPSQNGAGGSASTSGGGSGANSSGGFYDKDTDYMSLMQDAANRGDKATAKYYENLRNNKIDSGYGGNYQKTNMFQDYKDPSQEAFDTYYGAAAQQKYKQQLEAMNQAKVNANVSALNAQKDTVKKAGVEGNKAAQEAYMTVVNPNGSLAESLAARGLLSSGLTESSQISAGNAYQGALNNNQTTVTEQLAEIERAISQAQLSGDLATAEALASYYDKVASAAMQNAQNIISQNQWNQQNAQNIAGLTGQYNGQQTMQGQAAQDSHNDSILSQEAQQIQNQILKATGMTLAELEVQAQKLVNQGYTLDNAYKSLQNKYASSQFS